MKTMKKFLLSTVKSQLLFQKLAGYFFTVTLLCISFISFAQQGEVIKGKVVSATDKQALIGVTVVEVGTVNGTTTDIDGNFVIKITQSDAKLRFSFIGFDYQEVNVDNQTEINVSLNSNISELDEVIAIGYGTVKKSDLTGSVVSVKADAIKEQNVGSIENALAGKAAGVQVTSFSGSPGGGTSIHIRGISSLGSGTEPLYVIDGLPIDGNNNIINFINPKDIQSIEILKDASATAIYGSRASSGVVLIITKRGQKGKTHVNYEANYGVQTPSKRMDLMNGAEYAGFRNLANINAGKPIVFDGIKNPLPEDMPTLTDWQDEVLQNATVSSQNLSMYGGDEHTQFSLSANLYKENGIIKKSDFNRKSLKMSVDTRINEYLKVGGNVSYSRIENQGSNTGGWGGGVITYALNAAPYISVYDSLGNYSIMDPTGASKFSNPIPRINNIRNESASNRVLANVFAEIEPIKNLIIRGSYGADANNFLHEYYEDTQVKNGVKKETFGQKNAGTGYNYVADITVTYDFEIQDIHSFTFMGGYSQEENTYKGLLVKASDYTYDNLLGDDYGLANNIYTPEFSRTRTAMRSYFGRVNYKLLNRYLITATFRRDGASNFGENNKTAVFPSVAGVWKIKEEQFLKDISYVSRLSLRTSWGKTGNSSFGAYLSQPKMETGSGYNYIFNGVKLIGMGPGQMPNSNLGWEETTMKNIALDMGFLSGRINCTVELYQNDIDKLLMDVSAPSTSGFGGFFGNAGQMQNKGIEFSAEGKMQFGEFKFNLNGNIAANRNEITSLAGTAPFYGQNVLDDISAGGHWFEVGQPIASWKGLVYDGVIRTPEELENTPLQTAGDEVGFAKYKDLSGDGKINADDQTIIGSPLPKFIYGFGTTMSYRNFDFAATFNGSYGNKVRNLQNVLIGSGNARTDNGLKYLLTDTWTPDNIDAERPMVTARSNGLSSNSSYFLEDASFLRLGNMTFSYTFHDIKSIENLKLYVSGQNLFVLTKYSGYDPEISLRQKDYTQMGEDFNSYPRPSVFMIGLSASF
ncbi:MAG: SusC/RagA family TonB-linked outer membrane protein [Prolixibacteraceae bacterium]